MTEATYSVVGMTCEHCVHAVSDELGRLPGVRGVTVDLPTGAVTVTGSTVLHRDVVAAAVDEAGYELAFGD
ncbi:MAG: heavy-metal-associated domain-containing protein [Mycobacterium sp.]